MAVILCVCVCVQLYSFITRASSSVVIELGVKVVDEPVVLPRLVHHRLGRVVRLPGLVRSQQTGLLVEPHTAADEVFDEGHVYVTLEPYNELCARTIALAQCKNDVSRTLAELTVPATVMIEVADYKAERLAFGLGFVFQLTLEDEGIEAMSLAHEAYGASADGNARAQRVLPEEAEDGPAQSEAYRLGPAVVRL